MRRESTPWEFWWEEFIGNWVLDENFLGAPPLLQLWDPPYISLASNASSTRPSTGWYAPRGRLQGLATTMSEQVQTRFEASFPFGHNNSVGPVPRCDPPGRTALLSEPPFNLHLPKWETKLQQVDDVARVLDGSSGTRWLTQSTIRQVDRPNSPYLDLVLQAIWGHSVPKEGRQDRSICTVGHTMGKVGPNLSQVTHSWHAPAASAYCYCSGTFWWTGYLQRDWATPICPRGDKHYILGTSTFTGGGGGCGSTSKMRILICHGHEMQWLRAHLLLWLTGCMIGREPKTWAGWGEYYYAQHWDVPCVAPSTKSPPWPDHFKGSSWNWWQYTLLVWQWHISSIWTECVEKFAAITLQLWIDPAESASVFMWGLSTWTYIKQLGISNAPPRWHLGTCTW